MKIIGSLAITRYKEERAASNEMLPEIFATIIQGLMVDLGLCLCASAE